MTGKVCMVTGSNTGIGKASAIELAKLGAKVFLVCRNQARGSAALNEVKKLSGSDAVELLTADLSSQASIRAMADEFHLRHDKLHVLINNAGILPTEKKFSPDGIEMTFAVNHLGYFLLTNLLLDTIKASAPSRIVNVASDAHQFARMDFDNLQSEKHFGTWKTYGLSKLCNLMFTYELARRLEGTRVTVNAVHPGLVKTEISRDLSSLMTLLFNCFGQTLAKGAETLVYLASSKDVAGITGKYFTKKRELASSQESYNTTNTARLWEISAEMTGLK